MIAAARLELTRSRWPWRMLGVALCLALGGILASGLASGWKIGLCLVALGVARWEWRRQPLPVALQVGEHGLCCWLADGDSAEIALPLVGMATRYWLSFAVDRRRWRRRYVTVFADQLDVASYRRLRSCFAR